MRIKKRLRINAVVSLLVFFVVSLVLGLAFFNLNKANNSAKIAGNFIASSLERVSLRNDYIRSNRERAKDQWFEKSIQIGNLLKSFSEYFQSEEDKKIIGKMIEAEESINELFLAIVTNRDKNLLNAGLSGLPLEAEERLLNQLNISAYEGVIQGRALQESSREARASAVRLVAGGVFLALLVMIATAMLNLWSIGRIITDRVNRLCGGAMVIGDGDLDHRIDIKGDDEFFELSVAINEMTAKLSESYHDLKVEIEERKQAEEALRQSEERLALAASATQIGMFDWNLNSGKVFWTHMHEEIFGYVPTTTTCTEHDYRKWADRVHPEDLPLVEEEVHRCQQDRKRLVVQYRIIWPDASLHWVETKGVFQFDSNGEANRLLGVVMDITERKRAEEQIKASLAEKEVMLREIHHRVKNNLQVISSLVSMQADNLTDERTREEFDDVCNRVRSMALIHEKLYQTDDMARLNFADYSSSLLHSLWSSHDVLAEKVRLNLELESVTLSIETAVPCGLILNELAGNALKHAFPNCSDGEVTVGLKHDVATDTACLWVRDTGVGLEPGLDWRKPNSLGLRLVQILAGQLHGSVEAGTGPGAEIRVTFPLKGLQS